MYSQVAQIPSAIGGSRTEMVSFKYPPEINVRIQSL